MLKTGFLQRSRFRQRVLRPGVATLQMSAWAKFDPFYALARQRPLLRRGAVVLAHGLHRRHLVRRASLRAQHLLRGFLLVGQGT
jgi:hypothetical protein